MLKTTLSTLALVAALSLATASPANAQGGAASLVVDVHQATGGVVNVPLGKSRVIRIPGSFSQVVLARPATADVHVLSSHSFYVYGKAAGSTNVLLLGAHNEPVAMIDLEVGFDVDGLQGMINQMLPGQQISVSGAPNGVILTGVANDAPSAQQAAAIAERFAPGAVTNSMSVRGPQQVILEVRFLEAQRNIGRELGLNTTLNGGEFQVSTGLGLASGLSEFANVHYTHNGAHSLIDVELDALEERGAIHMLAEPNLTALSGDTATFLAGGEFPIPVAAANNTITVEFKQFGVALAFVPTVLSDGRINLRVSTEVSQLDENHGVRVERIQIPSLIVRRSATTIELNDGQSMAMAGLIQNSYANSRSQTPWVGDVPVLGALFASTRFQRNETELVVVVTPHLASAVDSQAQLSAPFHPHAEPNDPELFLGGMSETNRAPAPVANVPPTAHVAAPVAMAPQQAPVAAAQARAPRTAQPVVAGPQVAAVTSAAAPQTTGAPQETVSTTVQRRPRSLRDFFTSHQTPSQQPASPSQVAETTSSVSASAVPGDNSTGTQNTTSAPAQHNTRSLRELFASWFNRQPAAEAQPQADASGDQATGASTSAIPAESAGGEE